VKIFQGQNASYQIATPADAIAISLSEDGANYGAFCPSWQLDIYAGSEDGTVFVASTNTVAANASGALNRIVGYALSPGARSWRIEATGPSVGPPVGGNYTANLRAHPVSQSPPGLGPGFQRPGGRTIINGNLSTETGGGGTAPVTTFRTDFQVPIAFSGAFGSNETGTETIWIMWFNAASGPPANGTEPYQGLSFQVAQGGTFNFVAPPNGIFFSVGLTWAASTTGDTLTLAGADAARVVSLAQW
jgi:hypothetical protein